MISGAMRGRGGDALALHLLKAENESVVVIPARGLGSEGLVWQVRELVALSSAGRTDRPVYHVHADPDLEIADNAGARARWWTLFEAEFGLTGQPYCGAVHVKHGRRHEHRVYSLVKPSGAVIDLAWDYLRREKVSRVVEFEFGAEAVPSKHARAIERWLREEGRAAVADWLIASGTTEAKRPVAALSPVERLVQERTGVPLDGVRHAALDAWRASDDGPGFERALAERGLSLRAGRSGPLVVDGSGTPHLATRLLGSAARRFEGDRIPAAAVHDRLDGLSLKGMANEHDGDCETARRPGQAAARDHGGPGAAGERGGGLGIRRPRLDVGGPDGCGFGHDALRHAAALGRLRSLSEARGAHLRRRLMNLHARRYAGALARARDAVERIEANAAYERDRAWALWAKTDIWGIPLT